MDWFVAVGGLSNCTNITNTNIVGIRLSKNSLNNILSSSDIYVARTVWEIVGFRRDQPTDVENIIGTFGCTQYVVVFNKVAPDDTNFVLNRS